MQPYLDLLRQVLEDGTPKNDRTGTGTLSVFGAQLRFDLSDGFPLVTTKRIHAKSVIHELLWFISGSTNVRYLQENGVSIWDEWADADGELGPVYGHQWRSWSAPSEGDRAQVVDQLAIVERQIRKDPDSRRMVVSAWNVTDLPRMKLPPCHLLYQFNVSAGRLSCGVTMRSCDLFLGLPFNIASYGLLTQMLAETTDLKLGDLVLSLGDAHIYSNHTAQVREQLEREPRPLPKMHLDPAIKSLFDYHYDHFHLKGYDPHPRIAAPIAV